MRPNQQSHSYEGSWWDPQNHALTILKGFSTVSAAFETIGLTFLLGTTALSFGGQDLIWLEVSKFYGWGVKQRRGISTSDYSRSGRECSWFIRLLLSGSRISTLSGPFFLSKTAEFIHYETASAPLLEKKGYTGHSSRLLRRVEEVSDK